MNPKHESHDWNETLMGIQLEWNDSYARLMDTNATARKYLLSAI